MRMVLSNFRTLPRAFLFWTAVVILLSSTSAFAPTLRNVVQHRQQQRQATLPFTTTTTTTSTLFMSDVPQQDDKKRRNKNGWKDRLPPPPEDQLTMSGDIVALFVYSFLDHFANQIYSDSVLYDASPDVIHSLDPSGGLSASQLPVWFDAASSFHLTSDKLMSLLGIHHVAYSSPILGSAGTASVLLCACWLLSGYLHQAFSFRNTLDCATENALWVTFRSWITCSLLMVAIALGAEFVCGHTEVLSCNCLIKTPTMEGLTKADADFIFDSLSVLITWRFILSSAFGYGGK